MATPRRKEGRVPNTILAMLVVKREDTTRAGFILRRPRETPASFKLPFVIWKIFPGYAGDALAWPEADLRRRSED
jgi:hypothetical protein